MKKLLPYFARLALISLLAAFCYFPATYTQVAQAAVPSGACTWVNNQSGSIGAGVTYDTELAKTDPATAKANYNKAVQDAQAKRNTPDPNFASKIAVITEEPLGINSDISVSCQRVTTCSLANDPDHTTQKVKKCFTVYQDGKACEAGTNGVEGTDGTSKYCEMVQVYVSDIGTSLLYGYIGQVYKYVAMLGGFIAVLILIIAGIMRAAAGDNPEMITKSTALFVRCITGLVVLFLSAVILYTINPNFFLLSQ